MCVRVCMCAHVCVKASDKPFPKCIAHFVRAYTWTVCAFLCSTKNTILKKYDGRFKDIFEEIYER